jgi:redox-sensitive bicupin YhaK (pirin superfamily)
MQKRKLVRVQSSRPVTDGDGVRINRSAAPQGFAIYDPFLLLDEIASDDSADYIGGFPEHPHRGFETVTYMLEGSMKHRDHMGNEGHIISGGVQWMTAGRGVLHSEMPMQEAGRLHGFQLWANLPASEKMCEPNYREFQPSEIPEVKFEKSKAKIIAGTFPLNNKNTTGPVKDVVTKPDYFDIHLTAGEDLLLPIGYEKRALIYVYQGKVAIDEGEKITLVQLQQLGILEEGDLVHIKTDENSRFLLLAGKPIGEPVVNWGPFVMNTREEIEQAIQDYRNGNLV